MRNLWIVAVSLVMCWLCTGCRGGKAVSDKSPPTEAELEARLNAASAITDASMKSAALASVAEDAAGAGAPEVVIRALNANTDVPVKNRAAATAALKLAGAGKPAEANKVAEVITDYPLRNKTLARLAQGEVAE